MFYEGVEDIFLPFKIRVFVCLQAFLSFSPPFSVLSCHVMSCVEASYDVHFAGVGRGGGAAIDRFWCRAHPPTVLLFAVRCGLWAAAVVYSSVLNV